MENSEKPVELLKLEQNKTEKISDEMFELGQQFSKMAREANTLKGKKLAFDMAVKAYNMVVKSEPKKVTDETVVFMEQIQHEMLRSDVWLMYSDWCYKQGMEPVPKSMFFHRLEAHGFRMSRKTQGWVVKPPLKRLL